MTLSVVIVEDDALWRDELVRLYTESFRRHANGVAPLIETFASGPGAIRRLKKAGPRAKIDVLSCDINLSHEHPRAKDGSVDLSVPGIDGFTVLRRAAEINAAACAVVPTLLLSDQELEVILPGGADVARLTIDGYLRDLFGDRQLRLDKTTFATPRQTVDIWIDMYGKRIVDLSNAWPRIKPPYTVANRASEYDPKISIWTHLHGKAGGAVEIRNSGDQWLLYLLGRGRKTGEIIGFETVYGVYRGNPPEEIAKDQVVRVASTEVNSMRRRLSAAGIDPAWLVESVRNGGFRLCDDVYLYGFGDATEAAEGFVFVADERPNPEEELIRREEETSDSSE